ncbi:tripartite tricarboxylate transporter substrate binding protein [Ottowia sp. GY511]|uniref:Bug family tripartite tricarboxylate transporter substrate binding protein n=1 Tax=Ottowia flava TaxID=2675430 RepID=A0ABW4KV68_9BURK|nr:tripartite tricarboxylate transporter substrate binding protein [Ottowia sp. GY511]TXK22510.1 tripartite tricarboxylate transporter substrate binding protein [Ottowia sp. GY511]
MNQRQAKFTRWAVGIGMALSVGAAMGQAYPSQAVKINVPFPPGGTTDILARQLAVELATKWAQPVVVENKSGASGTIYSEQLARSTPDGYTLMLTATHHVINPAIYKTLRYDTKTAFTPLAEVASVPSVLLVNPALPVKNVQELLAYGKAHPGKLSFGSAGTGGANHLSGELLKSMTGLEMLHVPYKGAAPALTDLLGGQIPVMVDSITGVLQHIKSGKVRALAVTSLKRSPVLPDVPTLDESGVKGFEATSWFGLYGPAHMKPELANKINTDVREVLSTAKLRALFLEQGAEPGTMTQPQFAKFVNSEVDKWAKVIATANVKLE